MTKKNNKDKKDKKGTDEQVAGINLSEIPITMLKVDSLVPSNFNFFKPLSDIKYAEMVESIRDVGVLVPLIVRPHTKYKTKYEILSGHNRVLALQDLDVKDAPCRIMDVNDDAAREIIVDTNVVQRQELTPMEVAKAYEEKKRAFGNRQGQRTDLEGGQAGATRDLIAKELKVSGMTVDRYLRLNNLNDDFQGMVDEGEVPLRAGMELGLLDKKTQRSILSVIDDPKDISVKKVNAVKKVFVKKNKLTKEEKAQYKKDGKKPPVKSVTITEVRKAFEDSDTAAKYALSKTIKVPADYDIETIETLRDLDSMWILELIKDYVHGKLTHAGIEATDEFNETNELN